MCEGFAFIPALKNGVFSLCPLRSPEINGESIKTAKDLAVKLFVEKHRIGEFLFGNPGEPLKHWIITFLPASVSRSENGTRFALEAQVLYQRTQMRINKEYLEDVEISCEEISGPQPFDVIITFGNFEEIKTEEPKTISNKTIYYF